MSRSTVQPNTNMIDLMEQFGTDEKCRQALTKLRWSEGVRCPRCKGAHISNMYTREQYDCDSCGYQFSVTSGTIFASRKMAFGKVGESELTRMAPA